MGNIAKAATLGMPHGTANGRLKKQLLFKYIQKANEHFCYKCGAEIETVDELSIEHKLPWEGRSAELFWDLDNIAFSHLKCNRPHDPYSERTKKVGPPGTAWCTSCKQFLPKENFCRDSDAWDGIRKACRPCETAARADYRRRTGRR